MKKARYDDNAELDEVVADDVVEFHLERMNGGAWWIGLEHADGTTTHINIAARNIRSLVDGRCDFNV